jgi:cysteine desulfurase
VRLPIYLDHNATTPLDPAVFDVMKPYFLTKFGNPSSVEHHYGHEAGQAVEAAREEVAKAVGARPEEIVFTGSCTEANNLAIQGVARSFPDRDHFVTSRVEHPSVLEPFRWLENQGKRVTYLQVDESGLVEPKDVAAALTPRTALVSIMAANNEVGTLQDVSEIGRICEEAEILFHSDLAQAAAYVPIDVQSQHLHLASLSAHKAYGPKGVGALYVRSRRPRARLAPIVFGGGQERGLRSGTISPPLTVGMGAALSKAQEVRDKEVPVVMAMRDRMFDALSSRLGGLRLNGHATRRLPNTLSISIEGVEPHALIRQLREAVSFSASSACASQKVETSHVLLAIHGDSWRARNAIRLAPGRFTKGEEIDFAIDAICEGARRLRSAVGGAVAGRVTQGLSSG